MECCVSRAVVSIFKDWTGFGDQLGFEGRTMKVFLTVSLS